MALGGELVDGGQAAGQLGEPRVLRQQAAPGREAVDGRVVALQLKQRTLFLQGCVHQSSQRS